MPNPLVISIQVETSGANSQIGGLNKTIDGIGRSTTNATRQASQGLNSLERSASSAAITIRNQFSALGGVIQAAVGVGFAQAAKSAVQVAANFQLAELGIASFVKEGENAKKTFDDLKAFALTSPLQFSTILEASNQLLAYDTAAKDLIPTLRTLSTAMFAVTGGKDVPDKLKDVIRALGQIKAVGALTGEEMRQLQNAAIVTRTELAKAFGVPVAEFNKAIADRAVPAAAVIEATLQAAEQKFGKFGNTIEKSAAVSFSNFTDALQQAADIAIREYLPDLVQSLGTVTKALNEVSGWVRDNRQTLADIASGFAAIGTAIISYKVATGIAAVAQSLVAVAAGASPLGLVAAGIGLLAYETYRQVGALEDLADAQKKALEVDAIKRLLGEGKTTEDLKKLGYSLDQVKSALTGVSNADKAFDSSKVGDFGVRVLKDAITKRFELNKGNKEAEEQASRIAAAEKRAHEILVQAQRKEFTGLADIIAEYVVYRKEIGLSVKANQDLAEATRIRLTTEAGKELRRASGAHVEQLQDELDARIKYGNDQFRFQQEFEKETLDLGLETSRTLLENQERFAISRKESEIRQLELLNAQTVEQRIAVENQRAQIEVDYLQQSLVRKARNLDLELNLEVQTLEAVGRARGLSEEEIAARREALQRLSLARVKAISEDTEAAISAARENATIRSIQAVQSNNLRVFDGLKRNVEGLFDAVITRSKSFGQAIGDAIKLPILAALKEIVSTRIAAMLFGIFGGGKVGIGPGGQPSFSGSGTGVNTSGGNILGKLLGIGGAGALGLGGVGGGGGGMFGTPGAPGGTPGFSGPVNLGGAPGLGPSGAATSSITGSLSGAAGSLKGILSSLGGLGRGGAVLGPGSNGGALAQPGVGGAAGGAMLLGGAALGYLGLRRGGLSGLAMTTAGGALIGAKFGGPLGAAIGAGIGAVAGTIRLFIKGAEEKIVEKVKAAYGITISKSFARDPLFGIIKQTFGGDINVGIQSQQVRDLIELYAMSTGQSVGSLPRVKPISAGFSLAGGGLSQLPSYSNGQPLSLGQLPGTPSSTPQPVVVQLDPEATVSFLQGQAVESINNNPRVVQGAVLTASKQNAGRRQSLALAVNPGVLL